MRKRLGILVAMLFYYSGLVGLFRWRMQRAGKRLIILNYHHANNRNLQRHFAYLRRHYRVMHLEDALQELYATPQHVSADRCTIAVITFDDGYRDNYTHAFALAREWQLPITIFLIPGYIESGKHFWWHESYLLLQHAQVTEITLDGCTYHLAISEEKLQLAQLIDGRLRYAGSVAERELFLKHIRTQLAVPPDPPMSEAEQIPLSWAEILAMQQSGLVSFGSHTMHHPVLACLDDADELRYELEASRRTLQQRLGTAVSTFAYPIGKERHVSRAAVQAVEHAGYSWAVTAMPGFNTSTSHPLLLRRVPAEEQRHWLVLAAEMCGLWGYLSPLWKFLLRK